MGEAPLQLRIEQVLGKFGSVAELARDIGVSDNAIYKWLSGRGQPSVANLVALAKAAKVSIQWLATGESTVQGSSTTEVDRADFTYVPRYDVEMVAWRGAMLHSDQIVDYLAFKKEWVRMRLNADPRNLLLIEAVGDSMAPTLNDSDLLLVDLAEPRFRHEGIYVLRREKELEIKRLQRRPDGALNLISDNPAYEAVKVPSESVFVIGRVIWTAGRL